MYSVKHAKISFLTPSVLVLTFPLLDRDRRTHVYRRRSVIEWNSYCVQCSNNIPIVSAGFAQDDVVLTFKCRKSELTKIYICKPGFYRACYEHDLSRILGKLKAIHMNYQVKIALLSVSWLWSFSFIETRPDST